ncbi:hypothetical protein MMH89_03395 [Candidatus Comchoanobacter bicostacola]|uniref:Uncharacterized protein n=1 Tax=Candidatus Comchoanobacter bicostacola TaxID=2919598 RepID=A0ABY5DHY6_9GAMM|nr:hypothetical protein [Candidatus Comchoanobacter bicostacola]UTC24268.1 hypothetical protein MMH89_03395 [Candidatus Comchoanobacter bicostacola]
MEQIEETADKLMPKMTKSNSGQHIVEDDIEPEVLKLIKELNQLMITSYNTFMHLPEFTSLSYSPLSYDSYERIINITPSISKAMPYWHSKPN